jgi:RNA polymerase sigma-70 factor (ECF subfamily)
LVDPRSGFEAFEHTVGKTESFSRFMAELRGGDDVAAAEFFNRYSLRLVELARNRLGKRLAQKVDPEDVMQSVLKSFFRRRDHDSFKFDDWDNLWAMLIVLTLRKCGKWVDHFRAAKRDVRREVAMQPTSDRESANTWQPAGHDPSPSEVAMLTETVEQIMRGLDADDRRIVTMRLQEYTVPEIAAEVNLTERTVHRVLKRVRERLEHAGSERTA